MDIGVLGGTFDPVHFGHMTIAEEARQRLELSQVIFIPAGLPWLKADREITPAIHRVEMLKRAIAANDYFKLSTIEIDRIGPTYTIDTVAILQRQLGTAARIYLLLGWDSLLEFPSWKQPAELVRMCQLVAFTRTNVAPPDLNALEASVPGLTMNTILLHIPPVDISSSDIRSKVSEGLPINGLVPDEVGRYIVKHKLYRKNRKA